jgi:hypothetical protein
VLAHGGRLERAARTQVRPLRLDRQPVGDALGLVERAVEAGELVVDQGIGGRAPLELRKPLVVGVLVRLEGAHELLEGRADAAAGLGFEIG